MSVLEQVCGKAMTKSVATAVSINLRQTDCGLDRSPEQPKAIFQFYRPSDNHVLCELTLSGPANTSIDREGMCGTKTGISVVGINGINAKEGWVSFDLRK